MTREEAIVHIKDVICENNTIKPNIVVFEQEKEALYMEIKALEQEPFDIETYCKEHFCVMVDKDVWEKAEKALEQDPCEDAISRQALLEEIENGIKAGNYEEGYEEYSHINDMDDIIECIKYADSIQPKPKTGHWITWKEAGNEIASETKFECSVCHDSAQTLCNGLDLLSPYCPNCGARMKVGE